VNLTAKASIEVIRIAPLRNTAKSVIPPLRRQAGRSSTIPCIAAVSLDAAKDGPIAFQ
jgi:hypothetical protein